MPQKRNERLFEFAFENANTYELVELVILARRDVWQREKEKSASYHSLSLKQSISEQRCAEKFNDLTRVTLSRAEPSRQYESHRYAL